MRLLKLAYVMLRIKLLSPAALLRLASAIRRHGVNLMALLRFAAGMYGDKTALVDERDTLTYRQLYEQSAALAAVFGRRYGLAAGRKAGLLCRNHASMVKAMFAVSGTGADLYLLNTEMSGHQLARLLERLKLDLIVYDEAHAALLAQAPYAKAALPSYHDERPSVDAPGSAESAAPDELAEPNVSAESDELAEPNESAEPDGPAEPNESAEPDGLAELNESVERSGLAPPAGRRGKGRRMRAAAGRLVLLTGGTTGKAKEAAHKPSPLHYVDPLAALLSRLKVDRCDAAYIATPIYHGYGIAMLLLFCALGKKVVIRQSFEARQACRIVREHRIEAITVVPLMLHRMLRESPDELRSLRCIASGGAELNPRLAEETLRRLGDVLYNLYGTSEGGLNAIATPRDLACSPRTIGRRIPGSGLAIVDGNGRKAGVGRTGRLVVRTGWRGFAGNRSADWIETGDLGFRDGNGLYYLCGRADSMIVSAGENVYPYEVEQVLLAHPQVEDAAVIGVADEQFGQRLKAFVQLEPDAAVAEEALREWLRERLARYQMPKTIVYVERLPYTSLGKPDRRRLE